jgi:hypothetical protein
LAARSTDDTRDAQDAERDPVAAGTGRFAIRGKVSITVVTVVGDEPPRRSP